MKYTIKDLAERKVALLHTGTLEELKKILKEAFPKDKFVTRGTSKIYVADAGNHSLWTNIGTKGLPMQETSEFLDNIEPIGTKSPEKLIRRFPSGAVRSDSTGRPRPDWVSPYAIEAIGQHLAGNVNDFGAVNYFLGIPEEACLESLTRHYIELSEAMLITKDGKATKEAVTALAFNATALLHTIILKEKGLYKEVYDKTELVTVEEAKKGIKFTGK